jgi:hypothetical protein
MPCKHFEDVSNPVPSKKPKRSIPIQSSTGSITSMRTSTTRSADITAPDSPPCTQSHTQPHAPEDAGGNTEDVFTEPELIEVTNSDDSVELIEDDNEELGGHHAWLRNCKLIEFRMPVERLGHTDLCFLQTYTSS